MRLQRSLPVPHACAQLLLALACIGGAAGAHAAEFAIAASPPRYELALKPGERSRQVLEISNAAGEATPLTVKTADWSVAPDASVTFHEELQPGSCRPWVAIERRELTVPAGQPYRFRYEVSVPADAPAAECRLAIMLEGQEQVTRNADGISVPLTARLGVIVYVVVGGAAPELSVVGARTGTREGRAVPLLEVRNTGTAHGRLAGFLKGTDASGARLEFTPSNFPVLAGETRFIELTATREGNTDAQVQVQFPVTVTGKLEWGKDRSQNIEQRFTP
ncbi:MAG: hypothetical protein EOO28_11325 [Comamonadaceae bacterium]|nr:MAG: hypothetical protein EOO28_11325 [Comamonadaceae bacterium]